MAYGDYSGPDKPSKGHEDGACNRQRCQAEPARNYNHGSYSWYCDDCANDIGNDVVNLRHWEADWRPDCGHAQFETRAEMDARSAAAVRTSPAQKAIDPLALASITTGTLLCADGFGVVHEAAEWLVGHPVWTHEFVDPAMKATMIEAALSQFPDMPTSHPDDWRKLSAELRERYGETVVVRKGDHERDRNPVQTMVGMVGGVAS